MQNEIEKLTNKITQLEAEKKNLQTSLNTYKQIFHDSFDVKLLISAESGIIKNVNHRIKDILGFSREEVIEKHFSSLFPKDQKNHIEHVLEKINVYGANIEAQEFLRSDGKICFMDINVGLLNGVGNPKYFVVTLRDVSERKELEEQVRLLSMVVSNSPNSVVITNVYGIIEYVNNIFTATTGYKKEEVVGKRARFLKSDKIGLNTFNEIVKTVTSGNVWKGEVINRTKSNEYYWEELVVYPIRSSKGKVSRFVAIFDNITERKTSQEKLKIYTKELEDIVQRRDKFFAILAHDLRSPFDSLLGFSYLLANEIKELESDDIEKFSNNIYTTAKKIFQLLENLLQWSKLQSGSADFTIEEVDLTETIKIVIELLELNATNKRITLINNIEGKNIITTDKNMIFSIVQNLISNAIKFTNIGGRIIINSFVDEKFITIQIEDNGVGMGKEILSELFKVGSKVRSLGTNQEEGNGLGLILSKEMIELNGGKLWAESEKGIGSKFYFSVPKIKST